MRVFDCPTTTHTHTHTPVGSKKFDEKNHLLLMQAHLHAIHHAPHQAHANLMCTACRYPVINLSTSEQPPSSAAWPEWPPPHIANCNHKSTASCLHVSQTLFQPHGAVAESAQLAEHCGHGHRSAVPLSPLCGLCSGGGSEFIEAELDSGVFVKKGYSDAIVERITRWIDDNATLPDRPGDKSQK